jgi:hypothetical protein
LQTQYGWKRWEKYTDTKIGIGREFERILQSVSEGEGSRFDRAVAFFEETWENAPVSNMAKLWDAKELKRKSDSGIEKSKAGRKRKIDEKEEIQSTTKRRVGRPNDRSNE